MAGDWMKVELATPRKPELCQLAEALNCTRRHALGLCVEFWAWASSATADGALPGAKLSHIDDIFSEPGFAKAMSEIGWLRVTASGLSIPKFDRHNSQSAKRRALATIRKARQRAKTCHENVTPMSRLNRDKNVTREEKRREEKSSLTSPNDLALDCAPSATLLLDSAESSELELIPGATAPTQEKPRQAPVPAKLVEAVYQAYPRHVGKKVALVKIKAALREIAQRPEIGSVAKAGEWLLERVRLYAQSPAGQRGKYVPYPQTWFHQGRYDDDPADWARTEEKSKDDLRAEHPGRVWRTDAYIEELMRDATPEFRVDPEQQRRESREIAERYKRDMAARRAQKQKEQASGNSGDDRHRDNGKRPEGQEAVA